MKQVYKYDADGYFTEPAIIEADENGNYNLPENCTFKVLPQPNYKPKYYREIDDWIETSPMPVGVFINPMWNGIYWTETPPSPIDDVTLLKESDAFTMLQLMDTQQQLADAHSKLDTSQQTIADLQTQLSEQIQTNADLTLQLVMKGVL